MWTGRSCVAGDGHGCFVVPMPLDLQIATWGWWVLFVPALVAGLAVWSTWRWWQDDAKRLAAEAG